MRLHRVGIGTRRTRMSAAPRGAGGILRATGSSASGTSVSEAPPRKVLITNDDGPDSPFFGPLVRVLAGQMGWKCVVALPASEHSFCSKLVSKGPIRCMALRDTDIHRDVASMRTAAAASGGNEAPAGGHLSIFHLSASPGTCVNIALHAASIAADCDFVISGPNVGHNAGRSNILSSGTVGAAMEAAIAKRRAVALSFPFFEGWNGWTQGQIDEAASISGDVIGELWRNWDAGATDAAGNGGVDLYNVNVPLGVERAGRDSLDLVRHTFVDTGTDYTSLFKPILPSAGGDQIDDRDVVEYEWGPTGVRSFDSANATEGSDVWTVKERLISVTPLRANLEIPRIR